MQVGYGGDKFSDINEFRAIMDNLGDWGCRPLLVSQCRDLVLQHAYLGLEFTLSLLEQLLPLVNFNPQL